MKLRGKTSNPRCPYCHDDVGGETTCPAYGAAHHVECLAENEGCATCHHATVGIERVGGWGLHGVAPGGGTAEELIAHVLLERDDEQLVHRLAKQRDQEILRLHLRLIQLVIVFVPIMIAILWEAMVWIF